MTMFGLVVLALVTVSWSNKKHIFSMTLQHMEIYKHSCTTENDSTPVHVAVRRPNPACFPVPQSTCNSILKVWICTMLKPYFNHKNQMWSDSRFSLTDRYLWLWSFILPSQKWIRLSKVISASKLVFFPRFSMAVARCYVQQFRFKSQ